MPRGPRRNLRPVADRKSQPISSTSRSSCPTAWQASSRNGTPAERASAPISAAGFTSPPFVGTWVNDTRATSPPCSAVRHRGDRHLPGFVAAHPLDDDPVLLGGAEEGDRVGAVLVVVHEDPLPPLHRHRPERRVPRRRGVGETSDLVRLSMEQASNRSAHGVEVGGTLAGQLVSARGRLLLQVLQLGVDDHLRRQRRTRVVEVDLVEFRRTARRHRTGVRDLLIRQ